MNSLFFLTNTSGADPFAAMSDPIVTFIESAFAPLISLVVAIGVIYCVFLGLKLAKAEEPQDREKAKQHLKNAIIGFILIFVLVVALRVGVKPLQNWVSNVAK